ncbi:hypothetical protein A2U01_0063937, partial [Trifolium medium]|nr:hypothetical protein [Trifolium medium]
MRSQRSGARAREKRGNSWELGLGARGFVVES